MALTLGAMTICAMGAIEGFAVFRTSLCKYGWICMFVFHLIRFIPNTGVLRSIVTGEISDKPYMLFLGQGIARSLA